MRAGSHRPWPRPPLRLGGSYAAARRDCCAMQ